MNFTFTKSCPLFFIVILLFPFTLRAAYQDAPPKTSSPEQEIEQRPKHATSRGVLEVISKHQGLDVNQYMRDVFNKVKSQPSFSAANKLLNKKGKLNVEFSILPSGDIEYTKVIHSTGDQSRDQAMIDAIHSAAPFPELGKEFKGKSLKIRWHMDFVPPASNSTNSH